MSKQIETDNGWAPIGKGYRNLQTMNQDERDAYFADQRAQQDDLEEAEERRLRNLTGYPERNECKGCGNYSDFDYCDPCRFAP